MSNLEDNKKVGDSLVKEIVPSAGMVLHMPAPNLLILNTQSVLGI
jgi:hypothetical protein